MYQVVLVSSSRQVSEDFAKKDLWEHDFELSLVTEDVNEALLRKPQVLICPVKSSSADGLKIARQAFEENWNTKVVLYGRNRVTGNDVPTDANANGIFYTQGELNLNQQKVNGEDNAVYNIVKWTNIVGDDANDAKQLFTLDNDDFVSQSDGASLYDNEGFILTENGGIIGAGSANSTKANKLNTDDSYIMIIPQNLAGNGFYVYAEYDVITLDSNLGNTSNPTDYENIKSKVTNHISTPIAINFQSGKAYTLNLQLGMTSVKVTADVDIWVDGGSTNVDLPKNTEQEES